MQIATFQNETEILGFYLLKKFELKTGRTNKQYIDIDLEDKTGQINGKIWNTEGIEPEDYEDVIAVKVKGRIREFNGTLQVNVEKIRPVKKSDKLDLNELVPSAPLSSVEMFDEISTYADAIKKDGFRVITKNLLERYKDKLMFYPAAKANHHSIRAGLLFHILRMLRTAEALSGVYEGIDTDVLYTGVMLHDIAKMEEMDANSMGVVSEYTTEGELLGHITIGANLIHEIGLELEIDRETVMMIQHMILSHHYEPDFGSPKKPRFLEAELLHHIDMIDARVFDMQKAVKTIEKGTFTDPVFSMDRRRVYKPNI